VYELLVILAFILKYLLYRLITSSLMELVLSRLVLYCITVWLNNTILLGINRRIKQIVSQNKKNIVLELQQRSIEFSSIIQRHQSIRPSLLERMPALDEASYLLRRASATQATLAADKPTPAVTPGGLKLPNGVAKPATSPLVDLLDLSSDDVPAITTASTTTAPNDFLQDLLGIGGISSSPAGIYFNIFIVVHLDFLVTFLIL
jgi:AP-1 complex subunit gamma-1